MPAMSKLDEFLEKIANKSYQQETLELKNWGIDDEGVKALARALKTNPFIKRLILDGNKISDIGVNYLEDALSLSSINTLSLSSNKIGERGAELLAKSKIEFLDLSANEIGVEGARFLSESKHILKLSLSECGIGDVGAKAILGNKRFQVLDLSANDITDEGISNITRAEFLREINLSQNELTSEGAKYISKHRKLEKVDLSANWLGDEGAKFFAADNGIVSLNLMQNQITQEGFRALFGNKKIKTLKLFNNRIGFDKDDVLSPNDSLVELGLGNNKISGQCGKVLEALASIDGLRELDLVGNNIDDKGAAILHSFKASSLRKMDLSCNHIKDVELVKKGFSLEMIS